MRPLLLILLAACLHGQTFVNPDLEKGTAGSPPEGWFVPTAFADFRASWLAEGCHQGKGCAELAPTAAGVSSPGNLMQMFDAGPYRGKLIRYRAAVKVAPGGRAGLWLRIDRPGGVMGFFDNMQARPIITNGEWQYFEINGLVHADAEKVALGILAYGTRVLFDDATLTVTGELPVMTEEPARPLTAVGLRNLTAFARLFGIVRHFHPSDEAAANDWNGFAIDGVRRVEAAQSAAELAAALQSAFQAIAPTIRVYTGAEPPMPSALSPAAGEAVEITRWQNSGFGQDAGGTNIYHSRRVPSPRDQWKPADIYRLDLGNSIQALVPLAVFTDKEGTLPHRAAAKAADPKIPADFYSAKDRATRIAGVVIAWNIFRHFYPYFDVAKTDWDAELPVALREAAAAKDGLEFHGTLLRMVAALKDGHGRVGYSGLKPQGRAPLTAGWIENKYIVTWSAEAGIQPGDEIVAIDGKPSREAIEAAERLISAATPQWKRARSISEVLQRPPGEKLALTIRPFGATANKEVSVLCGPMSGPAIVDARPKTPITELEAGIWYVDLTRAQDKDFDAALPKLVIAKGIVFDMRGYPRVSPNWFTHISKTPLRSAQWHVPLVNRPGEMTFERQGEWNLQPKEPYLGAKRVFLTNGGAISYAESTMGIVEAYKLGEILGETTAGTNGNVNPIALPGGYSITWTGMKVLKHDSSQHHGIGIAPTIPVAPTQAGVAAGRDEVLERGVALLR